MTPLPAFAPALTAYDAEGSGTLSQAEITASKLKVFARPDVPNVPGRRWRFRSRWSTRTRAAM